MKKEIKNRILSGTFLICGLIFLNTISNGQVKVCAKCLGKCNTDTLDMYSNADPNIKCSIWPSTIISSGSQWFFSATNSEPAGWPKVDSLPGGLQNAPLDLEIFKKLNSKLTIRPTYYFTKKISFNPNLFHDFTFDLLLADGAIIYVNGIETGRINMPDCEPHYNTGARSMTDSIKSSHFVVANSFFKNGNNTIQAEVHTYSQKDQAANHFFFDLELTGNRAYIPIGDVPMPAKNICTFSSCCNHSTEECLKKEQKGKSASTHPNAPPVGCCANKNR